jgi:hypothetical protein
MGTSSRPSLPSAWYAQCRLGQGGPALTYGRRKNTITQYIDHGAPPSKKQIKEREGAACLQRAIANPWPPHKAKAIRSVGLLKFIRNLDAQRGQMVNAGRFESEDALRHYSTYSIHSRGCLWLCTRSISSTA